MITNNVLRLAILLGVLFMGQPLFTQNSAFIDNDVAGPRIKKGRQVFHMNRFVAHVVEYTSATKTDSLCLAVTDSLRFWGDTLLIRICGLSAKGCNYDSVRSFAERPLLLNDSYWDRIPVSRLIRIKSKRQPLALITSITVGVSYVAFMSSVFLPRQSDGSVGRLGETLIVTGFPTLIGSYLCNVYIAKKRFRFQKFNGRRTSWYLF